MTTLVQVTLPQNPRQNHVINGDIPYAPEMRVALWAICAVLLFRSWPLVKWQALDRECLL